MSRESGSPSTIMAGLTQNFGYSKAILDAIKAELGSSPRKSADIKSPIQTAEQLSLQDLTAAAGEVVTPKLNKNLQNEARQRKSLSCDLSNVPSSSNALSSDSKKSQSLRQVDELGRPNIESRTALATSPSNVFSPSVSIRKAASGRTGSTASNSSKSSKDKEFGEEPIAFKICAEALYACAQGESATIKKLINQTPHLLNYAYPNCYRLTCLHVAARCGHLSLIRYLVTKGANLNARDDNWQTPMHLAAKTGKNDVVRLLNTMGADAKMIDVYGRTANSYLINGEENIFEDKAIIYQLGSSMNSMMAGISGLGGAASAANALNASLSQSAGSNGSQQSHLSFPFQRMGSLRPLKRQVNKVMDLFT